MKMSKKEGMAILVAAMASTFGAGSANANAVYTYTGNDFTTFTSTTTFPSAYTTSDFLTITLTLTAPLTANLNLASVLPEAVSVVYSDGVISAGNSLNGLPPFPTLEFSTNSTGDITNWMVQVPAAPNREGASIQTVNTPTQTFDSARIDAGICGAPVSGCTGSNMNSPGIWTLSAAVPGPTIGGGIPGLAFACGGLLVWWRIRRTRGGCSAPMPG
jgi:hypothetical protein